MNRFGITSVLSRTSVMISTIALIPARIGAGVGSIATATTYDTTPALSCAGGALAGDNVHFGHGPVEGSDQRGVFEPGAGQSHVQLSLAKLRLSRLQRSVIAHQAVQRRLRLGDLRPRSGDL